MVFACGIRRPLTTRSPARNVHFIQTLALMWQRRCLIRAEKLVLPYQCITAKRIGIANTIGPKILGPWAKPRIPSMILRHGRSSSSSLTIKFANWWPIMERLTFCGLMLVGWREKKTSGWRKWLRWRGNFNPASLLQTGPLVMNLKTMWLQRGKFLMKPCPKLGKPVCLLGQIGNTLRGQKFKSAETVFEEIEQTNARGGNFLLGIGPKHDGSITDENQETLRNIGRLRLNSRR